MAQNSELLHKILDSLSTKRPIFHSEADFQHALAWELHRREWAIRLEKPFEIEGRRVHVDIWAKRKRSSMAIELKYKTRMPKGKAESEPIKVNGEKFYLKNQSAQDLGRCDFWRDVDRLQHLVSEGDVRVGYAIFLTNDSSYKNDDSSKPLDAQFRLHEREIGKGKLCWNTKGKSLPEWIGKSRRSAIYLKNTYQLKWKIYGEKINGFQYLLIQVLNKRRST